MKLWVSRATRGEKFNGVFKGGTFTVSSGTIRLMKIFPGDMLQIFREMIRYDNRARDIIIVLF